jgi:large subunit ribosomal protein L15
MQIHELKRKHKLKDKKRVGRGGKRGTTSGRGQKGQRSRAGRRIKPSEKELILKFPKLRGVKNKPKKKDVVILKTSQLEKLSKEGKLNREVLQEKKIIGKKKVLVKVLFDKEVNTALKCEGISFSKKAKESVLKAGGEIK